MNASLHLHLRPRRRRCPQCGVDEERRVIMAGIAVAAVVVIWAATGFYTIKEAERGVVSSAIWLSRA